MKKIFQEKAHLVIARWTILSTGIVVLFWTIYYLINGNIPIVKNIMFIDITKGFYMLWHTAPFNMRLLDIFAPIILAIYAILIYHPYKEKSKLKENDTEREGYNFIITFVIISSIFFIYAWIRYGLISGLISGLTIIISIAILLIVIISIGLLMAWTIKQKPVIKLWNWLSGN